MPSSVRLLTLPTQAESGAYSRDSSRFPRQRHSPFIYTGNLHWISPEFIGLRNCVPISFTAESLPAHRARSLQGSPSTECRLFRYPRGPVNVNVSLSLVILNVLTRTNVTSTFPKCARFQQETPEYRERGGGGEGGLLQWNPREEEATALLHETRHKVLYVRENAPPPKKNKGRRGTHERASTQPTMLPQLASPMHRIRPIWTGSSETLPSSLREQNNEEGRKDDKRRWRKDNKGGGVRWGWFSPTTGRADRR